MATRKAVSVKTRFEVFKRDSFKCQYCGKGAPEVLLRVDHIHPVSKGGANDLLNLITSCFDCNAGKGATELTDDSALVKQRKQLDELAQRREQLEMLVQWRKGLVDLDEQAVDHAAEAFGAMTAGAWTLNEAGRIKIRKLIKQHGIGEVLEAIQIARTQYVTMTDGKYDRASVELAYDKLSGICKYKDQTEDERRLYYIRGICRNRFDYCVEWECIELLRKAYEEGASIEYLTGLAKDTEKWSVWKRWLNEVILERRAFREFPGWREDPQMAIARAAKLGIEARPGEELVVFVARVDAAVSNLFR